MQAVHRHIPILIRALGSSYSELLHIISNPPHGSEHLLTQVRSFFELYGWNLILFFAFYLFPNDADPAICFLKVLQILSEGTIPSADLVATVKRLYETKLKVFLRTRFHFLISPINRVFCPHMNYFTLAGCYNSYSNIVVIFQKWGVLFLTTWLHNIFSI